MKRQASVFVHGAVPSSRRLVTSSGSRAGRVAAVDDSGRYPPVVTEERPSKRDWERFQAEKRVLQSIQTHFDDYDAQMQMMQSSSTELVMVFSLCFAPNSRGPAVALNRLGQASRAQDLARVQLTQRCVAQCARLAKQYEQVERGADANRALAGRIARYVGQSSHVHSEKEATTLKGMLNQYCFSQEVIEDTCLRLHANFGSSMAQVLHFWLQAHKQLFGLVSEEAELALAEMVQSTTAKQGRTDSDSVRTSDASLISMSDDASLISMSDER